MFEIRTGDCLEVLRGMADSSVDSIVTDPPYGLSFMGKKWDYDVPDVAVWAECLRVLKPGGHLLAFAGTRTQHRMAVRIEDAGFEIRDMIAWVYGSGFPKSLDVSKAIDKRGGNAHLTAEIGAALKAARKARGISIAEADRTYCGGVTLWSWYEGRPAGQQMPTAEALQRIASDWAELRPYADAITAAEREVVGQKRTGDPVAWYSEMERGSGVVDITTPATPAAQQWAGWGTALKPALEPITVARKPLVGTVAENVLAFGTGALNIDGCRVGDEVTVTVRNGNSGAHGRFGKDDRIFSRANPPGRWPANLIHDGSEEVVGLFPVTGASKASARGGTNPNPMDWGKGRLDGGVVKGHDDAGGSAARFFYCAKASKADRGADNHHPTVKPTALMRYLCRLVTPPGGLVLDPFAGSGSTGRGALLEGFRFLGIERDPEYAAIAQARCAAVKPQLPL